MVDRRSTAQVAIQAKERPEIVAAREELTTLDKLSQGLATKISELVRERPHFDRKSTTAEFGVHQVRYSSLKGYEELAHHCYGRTVLGDEIASDGHSQGRFTYRITQANVGYVDDGCYVLARNSPIASKLVTSIPGGESEISAPKGTRFLTVDEIRTFDGPVSLLSRTQKPNFRSMLVRLAGESEPLILQNIRAFLHGLAGQHPTGAITPTATPALGETHVGEPITSDIDQTLLELVSREVHHDPTWLQSWQGVYLSDSETSSLGHQFFTRTTPEQESPTEMAELILQRILGVDPYATVAVILPNEIEAARWHDLLREDLAANHRPALLSHRDDLTRRVDIHFTEVRETKGLEFDVVIVPDLSSFEFQSAIGINQVYVAISRSKHALLMGCDERSLGREELKKLVASGVIRYAEIPASPPIDLAANTGLIMRKRTAAACGSQAPMNDVVSVKPVGGFRLRIAFSDGSVGVHDFSSTAARDGDMVRPLKDHAFFARVFVELGALTWPNGFDLDPIALHDRMSAAGELSREAAE